MREKNRQDSVKRAYPLPRGYGKPRRWNDQRNQCAFGHSAHDGRAWAAVKSHFEVEHLVSLALLKKINITDRSVMHLLDNLWMVTREKNRGIKGKSDTPFPQWLQEIGEPAPVVDMGRQWYEHTVNLIVAAQQEIDPSYRLTPERREILGLDRSTEIE